MQTIGEYLKAIRQERGLSVEQVAGKTRISPIYIRALEENRLDPFPGEVFARGFVRVYGRCLGLDDQDTMSRFNQSAQAFFRERDENKRSTEQSAEQEKSRKEFQSRIVQTAVVATLALAILTVYGINTRQSEPPEEDSGAVSQPASETAQAPAPPAELHPDLTGPAVNKPVMKEAEPAGPAGIPSPPAGPVAGPPRPPAPQKPPPAPPEKPKEDLPLIVNVPGQPPSPPAAVEDLVLVIEAVVSSWVSAKIDGGNTKEVFLKPGESVTWKATHHFLVSFGDAGGVKVQFNGKPLPPFGPKGTVVKDIKISRD